MNRSPEFLKKLRLLVVSYRYWPLGGESSYLTEHFAVELARRGHRVTVATAAQVKQWPAFFHNGAVRIERIPLSRALNWPVGGQRKQQNHWARALNRWMSRRAGSFDAAICIDKKSAGRAVVAALQQCGIPLLVRIGPESVEQLVSNNPVSRWSSCSKITFIAGDENLAKSCANIVGQGSVQHVEDGVAVQKFESGARESIRKSLSSTHQLLELTPNQILMVNTESMEVGTGIFDLLTAWRWVASADPQAKLWLLGRGKAQSEVFRRICEFDLGGSVIMPGEFDAMPDLLQAADCMILPDRNSHFSVFVKLAVAMGLPVICNEASPAAKRIGHGETGWLAGDRPPALGRAIIECCRNLPKTAKLGSSGKTLPTRAYDIGEMADGYLESVHKLMSTSLGAT